MAMATHNLSTKSIDVGSMFLLDVSLHESDLNISDQSDVVTKMNRDFVFPSSASTSNNYHLNRHYQNQISSPKTLQALKQQQQHKLQSERIDNQAIEKSLKSPSIARRLMADNQQDELVSSSLDRLADAIDNDNQYGSNESHNDNGTRLLESVTIVEPQPPPKISDHHQPSSSLSDESFGGDSLSASYTASSEADDDDEERGSLTTREDSGVLDMKDLDSQLNNSYDNEEHNEDQDICHVRQKIKEKPISSECGTATNLINKSAVSITSNNRQPNKPTNNNNKNHQHHHNNNYYNNHSSNQSKRAVSASLPIQVPVRQMKKDLRKLKRGLRNKEVEQNAVMTDLSDGLVDLESANQASYESHDEKNHPAGADDFDEFLEQEYNDNHQNHYPIDEFDMEPLRAEENPMKLFESIQALARSLHEDTELFGSLPPKRIFDESPIRSLAFA